MNLQLTHTQGNLICNNDNRSTNPSLLELFDHIATRKMLENTIKLPNRKTNEKKTLAECRQLGKIGSL